MSINLQQLMKDMKHNKIRVTIQGPANLNRGASRFGGEPDVPKDFEWPYYCGKSSFINVEKPRPLSFLLQLNCQELASFDQDGLLPDKGVLSFFYEEESADWGYDPAHKGCAKVYYFEDVEVLEKATFPKDLEKDFQHPLIGVQFTSEVSYPEIQDVQLKYELTESEKAEEAWEAYMDTETLSHQVLGWPGLIQNNITTQCELISKGYSTGHGWKEIPKTIVEEAMNTSLDNWQLLLQLSEVEAEDFYLSFGDMGRLYFYIRKEDLKNKNFENVWMKYQCY